MTKQVLFKYITLFLSLFLINMLVMLVLNSLGFTGELGAISYLFPPLVTTVVLVMVEKKLKKSKRQS
ncbi:hypothetical protein [Streptococcus sp. S784/96/1]|uniref:hypothetical protein n=1 Tax=Streptococcus sp. S784/96/1 TaxID=2653499 RepID=UPI001389E7E1|nr:hypothetical protein [Streptococcus sp. S784/96/1]